MDYYSLTRKELQALCKKHSIPANSTNVSMADALTALFKKQEHTSEDIKEESVLTDISDTPKASNRSKRHGVEAEGKSAEEPILLDDEEASSALKEKRSKHVSKFPKRKNGDLTGKSKSRGQQEKILDTDVLHKDDSSHLSEVDDSSDVGTPHATLKLVTSRTCKTGRDTRSSKTTGRQVTYSAGVKLVKEGQGSCEKEKETDKENYESVEVVPRTRQKGRALRKKVDKVDEATKESIQVAGDVNVESVEEICKTRPRGRSSRMKVDKAEEAAKESIQETDDTNYEFVEIIQRADDATNDSVQEVPHTEPKGMPSKKKVDSVEDAIEESIQGTDDVNIESVEEVPKIKPTGRSSRKKVDDGKKAAEKNFQGTDNANSESIEEGPKARPKGRPSRIKVDEVEEASEEGIQTADDANHGSVEIVPQTRPRGRASRKKADEVEQVKEESIQESEDASKGDLTPICRRSTRANIVKKVDIQPLSTRSSRRKASGVDSIRKTPGVSKRTDASSKGRVTTKVEDSSDNEGGEPKETSTKVSSKKNITDSSSNKSMKTPVQTGRRTLRSRQKDSIQLSGSALEDSVGKVKQMCDRKWRNSKELHQSVNLESQEESNSDLECSDVKQDRISHRTSRKATMKSQGKDEQKNMEDLDILEDDLNANKQEEIHKGEEFEQVEALEKVESEQVEAPREVESEEVKCGIMVQEEVKTCKSWDEKQILSNLTSQTLWKVDGQHVCTTEISMEQHNNDLLLQEEKINTEVQPIPTDGILTSTEQSGIQEVKDAAEGSAIQEDTFTNSVYDQEGEASGIKDEEDCEKSFEERVSIAQIHGKNEPETMHKDLKSDENACFCHSMDSKDEGKQVLNAQEGEVPHMEDGESQEKTFLERVTRHESHDGTKPDLDLNIDDNAASRNVKQYPMDAKEVQAPSIEDEGSLEKSVHENVIARRTGLEAMHVALNINENSGSTEIEQNPKDDEEDEVPEIANKESEKKSVQQSVIAERIEPKSLQEEFNIDLVHDDSEFITSNNMEELNCSQKLPSFPAEAENPVEDKAELLHIESEHASWTAAPDMLEVQSTKIAELGTVAGTSDEDCLDIQLACLDDMKLVGEHMELEQGSTNLTEETDENTESKLQVFCNSFILFDAEHEERVSDLDNTKEEDQSAKDSDNLMSIVLEERSFEVQDQKVPEEVCNNEAYLDEVHISYNDCKNNPVFLPMEMDGATKGGVQVHDNSSFANDKSFEEDEDACDKDQCVIQAQSSYIFSEAVIDVSTHNNETDIINRVALSSAKDDNEVKIENRVALSSAQVDEVQFEKFSSEMGGEQEDICTDEKIIEGYSIYGDTVSNESPLGNEPTYSRAKDFVLETEKDDMDTIKDEKTLDVFNDDFASREGFYKEEKDILSPISEQKALATAASEMTAASQALDTTRGDDLGVGDMSSLAHHKSEQTNIEVNEFAVERSHEDNKVPVSVEGTQFHEKSCGPGEVQVTCVDKLHTEVNCPSLQIEKENGPFLNGPSFSKRKEKKSDKENASCLNNLSLNKLRALYKEKASKRSALKDLPSNVAEEKDEVPSNAKSYKV